MITFILQRGGRQEGHVVLVFKDWELNFRPGKFAVSLDV